MSCRTRRSDENRNLAGAERQVHAVNDRASVVRPWFGAETSDVGHLPQRPRKPMAFRRRRKPLCDSLRTSAGLDMLVREWW